MLWHRLLERQIKKIVGFNFKPDDKTSKLLSVVSDTYADFDNSNDVTQKTLEISSSELENTNKELELHKDKLEEIINQRTAELKQSILDLEKTKEALTNSDWSKTIFLANMSHELRTPLNAIVGFIDLILSQDSITELERNDYLNKIQTGAHQLAAIVNAVLEIASIEAGKVDLKPEKVDYQNMLKRVFDFYATNRPNGTTMSLHFDDDTEGIIVIDPLKVGQVFGNLLANAMKFGAGSHIIVRAGLNDKEFWFSVKDHGIGIANDKLDLIFNSFERVDSSTKRNSASIGLGLSTAKSFVHLMNGVISVNSELGKGSSFKVTLPVKVLREVISQGKTHAKVSTKLLNIDVEKLVLLVEDNEMNQDLMSILFSKLPYQFKLTKNGKEALDFVKQEKPDLVFMDLHMPVMDGFEATKKIREIYSKEELPIIALSADAFIEQQEIVLESGFNDSLTKPIQIDFIFRTLNHYFAKPETQSGKEI
jgi:signal transduction histidine kinase/CheY-like chemotaxis protein